MVSENASGDSERRRFVKLSICFGLMVVLLGPVTSNFGIYASGQNSSSSFADDNNIPESNTSTGEQDGNLTGHPQEAEALDSEELTLPVDGILAESELRAVPTGSISKNFTSTVQNSYGEEILLNQTISWDSNGGVTLSDDLGRSFSFGIEKSPDTSFELLKSENVVDQRVVKDGLAYDIVWTPVIGKDGDIEKYKFRIVGNSDAPQSIELPITTAKESLIVTETSILSSHSSSTFNATSIGPHGVRTNAAGMPDGIGIDWSDAISTGYNMKYENQKHSMSVDVDKSFDVDPTTVDTISTQLSPGKTDYYEGEKRVVHLSCATSGHAEYSFYYDGANIVYKWSTTGGTTWSVKTSSLSGPVNGDNYRWTVVNTKVGSTNYITILYFKANGANTDFYAKRATTSSCGGLTWSAATLLFSVPNNSACGTSTCAAAVASTDTSGKIFAAFRYLPSGSSTYKYQIRVSTNGGLSWSTSNSGTLAEQDSGASARISMGITELASGKMLFVYARYDDNDLFYRIFSGSTWGSQLSQNVPMTSSTLKQISTDSDPTLHDAYVVFNPSWAPIAPVVAHFTNTGSYIGLEYPNQGDYDHYLPSISIPGDNRIHIYTIGTFEGPILDLQKLNGVWQPPAWSFGNIFNSVDQLTAAFSRAAGLWLEGTGSPKTIKYEQNLITLDPGFGCGERNWGVSNNDDDEGQNPTPPIFGKADDCTTVLSTLAGRSNYVQLDAKNALGVNEPYEDAQQGCSPWNTCDKFPTSTPLPGYPGSIRAADFPNTNFPVKADIETNPGCISSCNLPADLQYRMQNQFLWITDGVSKPVGVNAHGYILTNIWFVDVTEGKTAGNQWENILVLDLPNTILKNVGGVWDDEAHSIGSHDSTPYYTEAGGVRTFHMSTVIGSSSMSGTWYDTGTIHLYKFVKEAFDWQFDRKEPNGTFTPCPDPNVCKPSALSPQSTWRLFDMEQGVSVQPNDDTSENTLRAAYSLGRLTYDGGS